MFGLRSGSSRQRTVRLSVLGLALAIWFQGCQCDEGIGANGNIKVPLRNVGSGSGQVDIPAATNENTCTLGPASGSSATCTISFDDAGAGGFFALNPAAIAGSVFVRWVGLPCTGAPTGCDLSFPQSGDFDFDTVSVEFAAPPTLATIAPNSGTSGAAPVTVNATLTGTDFLPGTIVSVSGGITTSNLIRVSATQLTVTLTIPVGASGVKKVTVSTQAGTSNEIDFAVSVPPPPTLASLTPNTGVRGSAPFDVTFAGTNFDATANTATAPGTIQFSNFRVTSPTQLIATVTIPANIATGAHNVAVTTQFGTSGSLPFQVTAPAPVLTSLVPNSGAQGASVAVRLLGSNFGTAGNAVNVTGTGITVSALTNVSTTEVDATFTISGTAALGSRNVSVTAPSGAGTSNVLPFTVTAAPPALTLTSVTPSTGGFGQVLNVSIVGTGFGPGLTLNIQGVAVTNLVIVDSTHLTATFTISLETFFGNHALTATIGSVTSNTIFFNVV